MNTPTEPVTAIALPQAKGPNPIQRANRQILRSMYFTGRLLRAASRWLFEDCRGRNYMAPHWTEIVDGPYWRPRQGSESTAGLGILLFFWIVYPFKAVEAFAFRWEDKDYSNRLKNFLFGPEEK